MTLKSGSRKKPQFTIIDAIINELLMNYIITIINYNKLVVNQPIEAKNKIQVMVIDKAVETSEDAGKNYNWCKTYTENACKT